MTGRCPDLHLLTGSYALDAVPDGRQAGFWKHLARCPSCAEEVRGLRETAARLAMATAITPPPGMRPRVLAGAQRARQLPPPGRNLLARAGTRTGPRPLTLSRAGLTAGVLALAAAVALLFVTRASANRQLRQAQANSSAVAAVLAAPDARIESAPATIGGTVTAVTAAREHEAVVTAANIPTLPRASAYQLWVMTPSGTARSAGLLQATSPGSAASLLASGVRPGDRLDITVEPAGGTRQPTTTPVVIIPVDD